MIKINLLPAEIVGKKRREHPMVPKTSSLIVLVLVLCFVVIGGQAYWVYSRKASSDKELSDRKAELNTKKQQIEKISKEFKDLKRLKELANNQIEILNSLDPPNRLLWSEKINMLSELIPRNVFVTALAMTERTEMVVTAESRRRISEWEKEGKKGNKPPEIKKPIITQTLKISGIAFDEDSAERLQRVVDFYYALKDFAYAAPSGQLRRFMDSFKGDIQIGPMTTERFEGVPVRKFEFTLITQPIT